MLLDRGCAICSGRPGPVCPDCAASLRAGPHLALDGLAACRSALWLDPAARELIAAFKYRGERRIARWLAREMAPLVPRAADLITWVPTTAARRRRRGYDQARELATALARLTCVPAAALLHRDGGDTRQTGLSRLDRLAGPQLGTTARSMPFVVLVDDVVTTGSSLRVAARLLRSAGSDRIVGVVAAATPRDGI